MTYTQSMAQALRSLRDAVAWDWGSRAANAVRTVWYVAEKFGIEGWEADAKAQRAILSGLARQKCRLGKRGTHE